MSKKNKQPRGRNGKFQKKGLGDTPTKERKKGGMLGLVLGGIATLVVGYMGYKRFFPTGTTATALPQGTTTDTLPMGAFPIKKGDKSQLVKNMQEALIRFGGTIAQAVTSTGGADGIYGDGTAKALMLAGYDNEIDQTEFNDIVKGISNVSSISSGQRTLPGTNPKPTF